MWGPESWPSGCCGGSKLWGGTWAGSGAALQLLCGGHQRSWEWALLHIFVLFSWGLEKARMGQRPVLQASAGDSGHCAGSWAIGALGLCPALHSTHSDCPASWALASLRLARSSHGAVSLEKAAERLMFLLS